MFSSFQTKLFLAALTSAAIALAVAGGLFAATTARQNDARIEQTLTAEARLAADLLARGTPAAAVTELDAQPTVSASWSARASRSLRPTAASSATRRKRWTALR